MDVCQAFKHPSTSITRKFCKKLPRFPEENVTAKIPQYARYLANAPPLTSSTKEPSRPASTIMARNSTKVLANPFLNQDLEIIRSRSTGSITNRTHAFRKKCGRSKNLVEHSTYPGVLLDNTVDTTLQMGNAHFV